MSERLKQDKEWILNTGGRILKEGIDPAGMFSKGVPAVGGAALEGLKGAAGLYMEGSKRSNPAYYRYPVKGSESEKPKPTKGDGKSSLPSLRRGDDIPAAQYPKGVKTGVGGGNAGSSQTQDPTSDAYIPPFVPTPPSTPTATEDTSSKYTGYRTPKLSEVPGMADINSFLSVQIPESASKTPTELDGSGGATETVVEGSSTPGKPGASPTDTADNNRSISVPGEQLTGDELDDMFKDGPVDPSVYATNYDARRTAQRNAFLSDDYTNSVDAVRASNQAIGVDQLGHKYYMRDGDELVEMSKEAYDKHRSTGLSAEEFKNARVGAIKETLVPADETDITGKSDDKSGNSGNPSADYQTMGYSQKDADTIAGGGAISTTIDGNDMKSKYFTKDSESEFLTNNVPPT